MKIKYEIYSSLIPEVKKLNESITKTLQKFTNGQEEVKTGWKIGVVTVTCKKKQDKAEIKKRLKEGFRKQVPGQDIWLKEVAYE
jgi:hypothetical protein